MAGDGEKKECRVCDLALIGVGLGLAVVLVFMSVDLAMGGRLSGFLSRGPKLASVTALRGADDDTAG